MSRSDVHTAPSVGIHTSFCLGNYVVNPCVLFWCRSGLLQNAGGLEELHASIDELSGFLDEVEAALMREVAQRSKSVFRAAGEMSTLHRQVGHGCMGACGRSCSFVLF